MLWLKLGWRNLWRNRRRTIIELTSIAGSVAFAIFINNLAVGSYEQMVNDGVRMGSGHIGIYREDYLELRQIELTFEADPIIREIEKLPEVMGVYPRLHVPSLILSSRENRPGGIIGLDFERETGSNVLLNPRNMPEGSLPEDDDSQGAILGSVLAGELDLNIGNKFVVMAQGLDGEVASELFRIRGVLQTSAREIDASTVITTRTNLARVIGKPGSVHEIAIMLNNPKQINRVLPRIREIVQPYHGVKAYPWQEAMPELSNAIEIDHIGMLIMVGFMYLLVGIGTINTLLMSVMERTREFGVIRAIGLNSNGIRKVVLAEALVLAIVGVIVGTLVATGAGLYTASKGIDYSSFLDTQSFAGTIFEPVMYSSWDWVTMAWLGVAMIVLALLASLYPAHQILKRNPSESMRSY